MVNDNIVYSELVHCCNVLSLSFLYRTDKFTLSDGIRGSRADKCDTSHVPHNAHDTGRYKVTLIYERLTITQYTNKCRTNENFLATSLNERKSSRNELWTVTGLDRNTLKKYIVIILNYQRPLRMFKFQPISNKIIIFPLFTPR